jgi:hypothetical protein
MCRKGATHGLVADKQWGFLCQKRANTSNGGKKALWKGCIDLKLLFKPPIIFCANYKVFRTGAEN